MPGGASLAGMLLLLLLQKAVNGQPLDREASREIGASAGIREELGMQPAAAAAAAAAPASGKLHSFDIVVCMSI